MLSGSSRRQFQQNPDGSWNVFCWKCGNFISTTIQMAPRALCALCKAVEEGKELSEDAVTQYKLSKGPGRFDVNILSIPDEPISAVKKKRRFSLGNIMGDIISAVGRFAISEGHDTEVRQDLPSVALSRSKRRPRLFSNVSIEKDDGIGSMASVDEALKSNDRT
jgi:hypothetical protein